MNPTQQILTDKRELEAQMTHLITEFEKRTGVVVSTVDLLSFERGKMRLKHEPLSLTVAIQLPPAERGGA